jgi:hypothetical protein
MDEAMEQSGADDECCGFFDCTHLSGFRSDLVPMSFVLHSDKAKRK